MIVFITDKKLFIKCCLGYQITLKGMLLSQASVVNDLINMLIFLI